MNILGMLCTNIVLLMFGFYNVNECVYLFVFFFLFWYEKLYSNKTDITTQIIIIENNANLIKLFVQIIKKINETKKMPLQNKNK